MDTRETPRLAVSAWSAISPYGIGTEPFTAGIRSATSAVSGNRAVVPDFDARTALGRKGTRSMDRPTALAVATVGGLLDQAGPSVTGTDGPVALVLGTSNGSVQSMMDFTRDSLTGVMPYHVDPARFPNTVMNCAAGQCAIWHGLRGPNTTIAGGGAASLLAMNYARRLWRAGHADAVLCGGVEELSDQRARLEHAVRPSAGTPLGEGCAMVVLKAVEPGEKRYAELVALEFGVHDGTDEAAVLARCVTRALASAGVRPSDIWAVATADRAVAQQAMVGVRPVWAPVTEWLGDTGAASAVFQLCALLALAEDDERAHGGYGLIPSVDRDGVVGCALVRLAVN